MAGIVNKQPWNLNLSNYCNQEKLLNLAVERMFNVSVPYLVVHDMIVSLFYLQGNSPTLAIFSKLE